MEKTGKISLKKGQIEEIVAVMRQFGATVGYLFGSYARGTASPESDVDVAVVFPYEMTFESQERNTEEIRNSLERIFGIDKADVMNIGALKNPLLLYIIVLGEGKVLFADDVSLKNSIALRAIHDFEDTRFLRRIQSDALKRKFV